MPVFPMFRFKNRPHSPVMLLAVMFLFGCMLGSPGATATPVPPTITPLPPSPTPRAGLLSADWQTIAPGLEQRSYLPGGDELKQLAVLRIDPAAYMFRAHYLPGNARGAKEWQDALPGAVAFVNANFFNHDRTINGLLVADGVSHGASYQGFGGMFQVQNGQPRVRSNILDPYLGEALEQAVQGFPMLVVGGGSSYTDSSDTKIARRTVVGQDSAGQIVLIVTPLLGLSLFELSAYLPTTDLSLVNALNLDGGASTMMVINAGASPFFLPSFDPVPAVLAVYPAGT